MRLLDLFAGIGGFSLAFERAGFKTAAFAETNKFCSRLLSQRWSSVPNLGDVRCINGDSVKQDFGEITVVTFGSPCQDLSVAGRRAGLSGEVSSLFHEAVRIVAELRPRFAVWENVCGAFSSNDGRDFGAVLDALAESGAMDIAWRVLDAQYFGVPQRRRRIFLAADFGGECAGEILFEPNRLQGHSASRKKTTQDVAGTLGGGSGSGGPRTDTNRMTFVAYPLTARMSQDRPERSATTLVVAPTLTSEGCDASEDGTGRGIPLVLAVAENRRSELRLSAVVPSLSCAGGKPGRGYPVPLVDMATRRLTPLECERLQGFPDDWTAINNASDSARYRALGNAVAVPVAEWIARRIAQAEGLGGATCD